MKKTVVLNVVALTKDLVSEQDTPNLWALSNGGQNMGSIKPAFPAVTCVSQATYLTGQTPSKHGITANGYYDERLKQVLNWHQSAGNVQCERLYEKVKKTDPNATVFVHTWWHSMYDENIDYMITVRPEYCSNGKKFPNSYTKPASMREPIHEKFGKYPLFRFWGPLTSIESSRWIADTSMEVDSMYNPTLSMIYLPHLDYSLQKYGPEKEMEHVKKDLKEIDEVVGDLVSYYKSRGAEVIVLSEYGINSVSRPVDINRVLREAGYIQVVRERGGETLDCGASAAFASVDHQIAHVHVKRKEDIKAVQALLQEVKGIEKVLTKESLQDVYFTGRCGDLIAVAQEDSWFTYYYWLDDQMAPDFARCIDIHTKPGYDPTEMFLRYEQPVKLFGVMYLIFKAVLSQLIGIRTLVDATPIDRAHDIKGSHGRLPTDEKYMPVLLGTSVSSPLASAKKAPIPAKNIQKILLSVLQRQ